MFENVWFDHGKDEHPDHDEDENGEEFIVHPVPIDKMKKTYIDILSDIKALPILKQDEPEMTHRIDPKMNKYLFRI